MLDPRRIVLASHGTPGARAADRMALTLCGPGSALFHLVVVPDFWKGMMGDDWLNNVWTRDVYAKYVEGELAKEIDLHRQSLEKHMREKAILYESQVVLGKPAECLIEYAEQTGPDLVVIGSPRPKGSPGFRSRMNVEKLVAELKAPLLVVPYPA